MPHTAIAAASGPHRRSGGLRHLAVESASGCGADTWLTRRRVVDLRRVGASLCR
ncbi:hypothetical protein [Streptomyces sp. NPDC048172]|uniref:hypothetical protein n=1 Tax=Streptomyces sp. NPDC048172 TaxID=3365505 RepID=UPI0037225727